MQTLAHNPADTWLDKAWPLPNNVNVLFNSGTGNASPNNTLADTAAQAVFLRPYHATRAPFLWRAVVGSLRAAGSNVPVLQTLPRACHPDCKRGAGLKPTLEATMPSITRALSRLFPATAVPVSTLPTLAEARALSALLVAQGRRAVFHRTAQGFTVEVLV